MRRNRSTLVIGALAILLIIPVIVTLFTHLDNQGEHSSTQIQRLTPQDTQNQAHSDYEFTEHLESNVGSLSMEHIMAKDLALTSQLLIRQLVQEMEQWSEGIDTSKIEEQTEALQEERLDHPQFKGFALVKEGEITASAGMKVDAPIISSLEASEKTFMYFDPVKKKDGTFMTIAMKKNNKDWLLGELDVSVIQGIIGDMAAVADVNGQFMVSSDELRVEWESKQDKSAYVTEDVPELGWQIVLKPQNTSQELNPLYHRNEIVVRLRDDQTTEDWIEQHPEYQIAQKNHSYLLVAHQEMEVEELIAVLSQDPTIVQVEPNYRFTKQMSLALPPVPNDEFFEPYQWNLVQIQADEGWEIHPGSTEVRIAVLDTGVDLEHQDLQERLVEGYNAFDDTNNAQDGHGHGTHVAGIIGAVTNNVTGIAGVSWYNTLIPVKVLDDYGAGSLFEVASGIRWATDNGAQVINMSLGDTQDSEILYEAIRYAYENDVVLISAAGNDNVSRPMYPAAYPEVMAVSALNQLRNKAIFSNYGQHIDVSAPGEHIPSTFLDNQYVFMSGTSMAAPHVSGLAGLIRSMRPALSNEEVMQLLRETAEDIGYEGYDPFYGFGEINVLRTLEYLTQDRAPLNDQELQEEKGWLWSWLQRIFYPK